MPPRLSIVTINLDMRDGLHRTLDSIAAQSFTDYEVIVVDGGSTDGSVDLLRARNDLVSFWTSEPDRGIYDAMNKGVALCRGDWVAFINAGDALADSEVLRDLFQGSAWSDADVLYGDCRVEYADGSGRLWRGAPVERLPFGMAFAHQAAVVRREILLEVPFGVPGIASDYGFFVRCWHDRRRFHRLDRVVAIVAAGGVSDRRRLRSTLERWRILRREGLAGPSLAVYYVLAGAYALAAPAAKRLLPAPVRRRLMALHPRPLS